MLVKEDAQHWASKISQNLNTQVPYEGRKYGCEESASR